MKIAVLQKCADSTFLTADLLNYRLDELYTLRSKVVNPIHFVVPMGLKLIGKIHLLNQPELVLQT